MREWGRGIRIASFFSIHHILLPFSKYLNWWSFQLCIHLFAFLFISQSKFYFKRKSESIQKRMQFFIRNLAGKSIAVHADPWDPLELVKWKIQRIVGIPVEEQRLSFGGHELGNDESLLAELGIKSGAILQLNLRLRAGGSYDRTDPKLVQLAKSYRWDQLICRKCYARCDQKAKNCRKCGSGDLRKRSLMLSKPL